METAHPIPTAALDDRLGIVGTAGAGKTYAASGAVERVLERKGRVIIPDPLGVWYGLRLMPDGVTPSPFKVVIFGGPHGDLPINEHVGALVGETVAGMAESAIIDLSEFATKAAERRSVTLPAGERATLIALSQYDQGCGRETLSVVTGYKRSSRDAYISRLIAKGYAETSMGAVRATPEGIAALGSDYERLPSGEALRAYWLDRLPQGERAVLDIAVKAYPNGVPRESIDAATGYKRSSRDAYISRLAARQLVQPTARGEIRASDNLFG